MLDLKMETFFTVCRTMNYTRASEILHISQPAVSQQIHALEQYYGQRLFNYSGKKLYLTEAGSLLLKTGRVMKNDEKILIDKMKNIDTGSRVFNFGVTMTIGEYVISGPLAEFLKSDPRTEINMEINNTDVLLGRMRSGEIQFALVEGYFDKEEFDWIRYMTVPFVPVCSAEHRFRTTPKRLEDLTDERLILREKGSGTRMLFENQLQAMDMRVEDFDRITKVGGMHAILEMLVHDIGISFLYLPAAEEYLREGKLRVIDLEDFSVRHDFAFIWQKGSVFSDTYREICKKIIAS